MTGAYTSLDGFLVNYKVGVTYINPIGLTAEYMYGQVLIGITPI